MADRYEKFRERMEALSLEEIKAWELEHPRSTVDARKWELLDLVKRGKKPKKTGVELVMPEPKSRLANLDLPSLYVPDNWDKAETVVEKILIGVAITATGGLILFALGIVGLILFALGIVG